MSEGLVKIYCDKCGEFCGEAMPCASARCRPCRRWVEATPKQTTTKKAGGVK